MAWYIFVDGRIHNLYYAPLETHESITCTKPHNMYKTMRQVGLKYCGFLVCASLRLQALLRLLFRNMVRSFVLSLGIGFIFAGWVADGQAQMRAQQWVDFDGKDRMVGDVGRVPVDEVVEGAFDEPFETKSEKDERKDERTALLKSLVLPGWGHFGLDASASTRGKIHIGTDLALLAGYVGADLRVGSLTDEYLALGELRAGVLMANRDRTFVLAMGNFNSLEEYNDYQLRSRNWNRLIEDVPANRWQWEYDEDRRRFKDIRERADLMENQLPAILGFMVINRVISGISAFNRTRTWNSDRESLAAKRYEGGRRDEGYGSGVDNEREVESEHGIPPQFTLMPVLVNGRNTGFTAHLRFSF